MSDSIVKLAGALVKAQGELKNPAMDAKNPHFKSSFASLKAVQKAILPVFNANGLAIVQRGITEENGIGINTVIIHESGEIYDAGTISIPVGKNDAQAYMSAATYARRCGLQTAAGVVGDPDDDGNGAVDLTSKSHDAQNASHDAQTPEPPKPPSKFTAECKEAAKVLGVDKCKEIVGSCGFAELAEVTDQKDKAAVVKALKAAIKLTEALA